jgi:hypothetical protein
VSNNDHRKVAIANFQLPVDWSRAVPERGIRFRCVAKNSKEKPSAAGNWQSKNEGRDGE